MLNEPDKSFPDFRHKKNILIYLSTDFLDSQYDLFLIPKTVFQLNYIFKIILILIPRVDSADIHYRTSLKILSIIICEKGTETNVK